MDAIVFECSVCAEIVRAEPLDSVCGQIRDACELDVCEHENGCNTCARLITEALDER